MDKIHITMGSVFILLHPNGVWIFSWLAWESLYSGHHWTTSFSRRYFLAIFCCLQRQPDLSYGLQANTYSSAVNFYFFFLLFDDVLLHVMITDAVYDYYLTSVSTVLLYNYGFGLWENPQLVINILFVGDIFLIDLCLTCFSSCRYLKSDFIFDLLGCMPWDVIFKVMLLPDKPKFLEYLYYLSRIVLVNSVTLSNNSFDPPAKSVITSLMLVFYDACIHFVVVFQGF